MGFATYVGALAESSGFCRQTSSILYLVQFPGGRTLSMKAYLIFQVLLMPLIVRLIRLMRLAPRRHIGFLTFPALICILFDGEDIVPSNIRISRPCNHN